MSETFLTATRATGWAVLLATTSVTAHIAWYGAEARHWPTAAVLGLWWVLSVTWWVATKRERR